jgi:hypothetical protein
MAVQILIGTDGSEDALAAARRAVEVLASDATIHLIAVAETPAAVTAGMESGFTGGIASPRRSTPRGTPRSARRPRRWSEPRARLARRPSRRTSIVVRRVRWCASVRKRSAPTLSSSAREGGERSGVRSSGLSAATWCTTHRARCSWSAPDRRSPGVVPRRMATRRRPLRPLRRSGMRASCRCAPTT